MTSRTTSQVQLELRLLIKHPASALFLVPGTSKQVTLSSEVETLREWQSAEIGGIVQVRIPVDLAERLGLHNIGMSIGGTRLPQAPKNG